MSSRILRGIGRSRHVFKREFILLVDRTNMLFSRSGDGFRLWNSIAFEDYRRTIQEARPRSGIDTQQSSALHFGEKMTSVARETSEQTNQGRAIFLIF
jgi:hypothetical protein